MLYYGIKLCNVSRYSNNSVSFLSFTIQEKNCIMHEKSKITLTMFVFIYL